MKIGIICISRLKYLKKVDKDVIYLIILLATTETTMNYRPNEKNRYIIVCGYARAGKTTFLAKQPYPVLSTSVVLDELCKAVITNLTSGYSHTGFDINSFLKDKEGTHLGKDGRDFKITMAEKVIVPILGRQTLVNTVFKDIPQDGGVKIIESIGGEELSLIIQYLDDNHDQYGIINLRHVDEQPGVDIRQLAPQILSHTIWLTRVDWIDLSNFQTAIDLFIGMMNNHR